VEKISRIYLVCKVCKPDITYGTLLTNNTTLSRKLLAAIQFITEDSQNKVATKKGWFTVYNIPLSTSQNWQIYCTCESPFSWLKDKTKKFMIEEENVGQPHWLYPQLLIMNNAYFWIHH
jgi:hypothetical protein